MTEAEWNGCDDPDHMLDYLCDRTPESTFRRFACACVRRHLDLLEEFDWARKALEVAERFAEGQLSQEKMNRAASGFDAAVEEEDLDGAADTVSTALWHLMNACKAIEGAAWAKSKAAAGCMANAAAERVEDAGGSGWEVARKAERQAQVRLLRCIVNPFDTDRLHPTPTMVQLARAAHDEPLAGGDLDPQRLAVLADALEEAGAPGCLVRHLREPGPHVRGCHAVGRCVGMG